MIYQKQLEPNNFKDLRTRGPNVSKAEKSIGIPCGLAEKFGIFNAETPCG